MGGDVMNGGSVNGEAEGDQTVMTGSRDRRTGQCYWPQRTFSVDGQLVELEDVALPTAGRLSVMVASGERWYGYVDLPGDVRLITELGAGPHDIGATYQMVVTENGRRFDRA